MEKSSEEAKEFEESLKAILNCGNQSKFILNKKVNLKIFEMKA